MMPSAIILINCEVGTEMEIAQSICGLEGAENAYIVYGVYDIVVKLTSETMDGLEALIMSKVRSLPGVKATVTLLVSRDCKASSRAEVP